MRRSRRGRGCRPFSMLEDRDLPQDGFSAFLRRLARNHGKYRFVNLGAAGRQPFGDGRDIEGTRFSADGTHVAFMPAGVEKVERADAVWVAGRASRIGR